MTTRHVTALTQYGLNETEATIYVFLLQHGEFRISDIANMNSLPRSSVYEALKHLSEKGLTEDIVHGTYKKIRALPFTSIDHYLSEQAAQVRDLASRAQDIERNLSTLPDLRDEPPSHVRYYEGVAGARQLFWNSLKASDHVLVYSSWGRSRFVGKTFYERFVHESRTRRITEKVLVENNAATLRRISQDTAIGTKLSRTKAKDIRVVSDRHFTIAGEIFIYDDTYAQITLKHDHITGFEVHNAHFSRMQKSIFTALWNRAVPFKSPS